MTIGMAVSTGMDREKLELASALELIAKQSFSLGLWVEGRPFASTVRQVAKQLTGQTRLDDLAARVALHNEVSKTWTPGSREYHEAMTPADGYATTPEELEAERAALSPEDRAKLDALPLVTDI